MPTHKLNASVEEFSSNFDLLDEEFDETGDLSLSYDYSPDEEFAFAE